MTSIGVDTSSLLADPQLASVVDAGAEHPISIQNRYGRILTFIEVLSDGITVSFAVLGGYSIYHWLEIGRRVDYSFRLISIIAFAMSVLYIILLDRDGAYRPGSSLLRIKETERSLRVSAQAFLLALPVTFFSQYQFSRWVFLISLLCVPVLLILEKQLFAVAVRALRARGVGTQRVIIYGAGTSGRRVFSALVRSPKLGLNPITLIDDNPDLAGKEIFADAYRREYSALVLSEPITSDLLKRHQCEFLVIAIPSLDGEKFANAVRAARKAKARIAFLPGQTTALNYWTEEADIDGLMLSVVGRATKDWHYDAAKRPFDLIASLLLIAVTSPIWLVVALMVRFGSPGPVLFRQKRVGQHGKLFDLYKFRTMYFDAAQYDFSPREAADPRITRIGRFLRHTSLDELPQLLNVVKGEMSLVGPRPEMPFIVEKYNAMHRQRLQVLPGITGLWQISADRAFLIHENIQYDFYYIRHRSFFMDFAILLHTVVFAMRGV
jgi:exopolysaccharide biosynthesis polyprenyl glycosylphosphotransferase